MLVEQFIREILEMQGFRIESVNTAGSEPIVAIIPGLGLWRIYSTFQRIDANRCLDWCQPIRLSVCDDLILKFNFMICVNKKRNVAL